MDRSMKSSEAGMSLIEVMMASLFLTVALLAVAGAMASGIAATYVSQEQLIAKQKAIEALESVLEARNTQQISWDNIQMVGVCDADNVCGAFVSGFQPIQNMGADGIPNTADDVLPIETLTYPGPDGILGTADDVTVSLSRYQRQITISTLTIPNDPNNAVDTTVRRIDIDVQYSLNGVVKTVRVSSLISKYS
jgi:type II secretory pathway pseudopilin PulG